MVELAKLIHISNPSLSVILFITTAAPCLNTENYINTVSAATPSIKFHRLLPTVPLPPDLSSDFMDLAFGIPKLYNPIVHNTLVVVRVTSLARFQVDIVNLLI
ncbi:hypothetical protein SSX86_013936 [Deinandra increscens subsp. villosa]|uniref:Uncharacterized protein n=1 Tax=Deinandra increscens subsp. villosa TaxID=3103831 RepID=A0AAP0GX64_9ASTR